MDLKKNKKFYSIKVIIVSLLTFTILLSVSYAYYSFVSRTKYDIYINNSLVTFAMSNPIAQNENFDLSKLTQEEFKLTNNTYGYLSVASGVGNISLSSGKSGTYVYCGYEIWYTPLSSTNAQYTIGGGIASEKKLTLVGLKNNHDINPGSVKEFEYELSNLTRGESYKVYEGYIAASNSYTYNYWTFYKRLYNHTQSQTFTLNKESAGRIQFKSKGCYENSIINLSGSNASYERNTFDLSIGDSASFAIDETQNSALNVTVSDPDIINATVNGTTGNVHVTRLKGGSAEVYIKSSGGYASVFFGSDIAIDNVDNIMAVNNGNPSVTAIDSDNDEYNVYHYNPFYNGFSIETNYFRVPLNMKSEKSSSYSLLVDVIKNQATDTVDSNDDYYSYVNHYIYNSIDYGYVYRGGNPDNYVWFNNERWRIISVVGPDVSDDGELIKIVRAEPLTLRYDARYLSTKDLLAYLNTEYYDSGTVYPCEKNETCHNCNNSYSDSYYCNPNNAITDKKSKDMVKGTHWYYCTGSGSSGSGGTYDNCKINTDDIYFVGIINIADICTADYRSDNICMGYIGALSQPNYNWLNPYLYSISVAVMDYVTIYINVLFNNTGSYYTHTQPFYNEYLLKPVVHLSSNVRVYSGDGSYHNPYVIG